MGSRNKGMGMGNNLIIENMCMNKSCIAYVVIHKQQYPQRSEYVYNSFFHINCDKGINFIAAFLKKDKLL
jgi:hypothetical protein